MEREMVVFCRRTPLTKRQLSVLQTHILKKRKTDQLALKNGSVEDSCKSGPEVVEGDSQAVTVEAPQLKCCDNQQSLLDQSDHSKDTEGECVEDVVKQIEVLQSRLESLREEKHRLFKQLKSVLHEEDERKRIKEQKEIMKGNELVPSMDPRMSVAGNIRNLPGSPTDMQGKPKLPLLPTPEQAMYSRQGPLYRYPTESFHNPRQQFAPQGHVAAGGHVPTFHEHFVPAAHAQDLSLPSSHEFTRTPLPPGQCYSQQLPVVQEQYPAVMGYQYSPTPSQFASIQSTRQSSQVTLLPYQQVPQQSYLQPHPQEILSYPKLQSQPQLQDVHIQPHIQTQHDTPAVQAGLPPYLTQGNQMGSFAEHNYGHNIQDPRHQKLVVEHQRCSSAGGSRTNSPVPLSSGNQEQCASPNRSPVCTQPRDRKYSTKK